MDPSIVWVYILAGNSLNPCTESKWLASGNNEATFFRTHQSISIINSGTVRLTMILFSVSLLLALFFFLQFFRNTHCATFCDCNQRIKHWEKKTCTLFHTLNRTYHLIIHNIIGVSADLHYNNNRHCESNVLMYQTEHRLIALNWINECVLLFSRAVCTLYSLLRSK